MTEAMRVLTGAPSIKYPTSMNQALQWRILRNAQEKQYAITGAIIKKNKFGLFPRHAYSVLGAFDLKKSGRIVERLVHIRNPHGREKYRGPWHDGDSRWTSEF